MKLANVSVAGHQTAVVERSDGALVDLTQLLGTSDSPVTIDTVISGGREFRDAITARLAQNDDPHATIDPAEVRWLPPSPRPSKIVGVAVNNRSIAQFAHRSPTEPAYFLKPPSALTGHNESVVVPAEFGLTHPEPELAAVIGRRSRNLKAADALDSVLGFTIINDITSPGLKDRDSMEIVPVNGALGELDLSWRKVRAEDDQSVYLTYHARSKGCDTFAPMGPWLVTTDEVGDPNNLSITCLLGGEQVLIDSTKNLTFSVQTVLEHLTRYMTLEPGDIVHFGTAVRPAAPERFPSIRSLDMSKLEGTFSIEIEGIGRLDNPISRV